MKENLESGSILRGDGKGESKMKIYYAHSKGLYGTPQEKRDVVLLTSLGFEVVNPGDKRHQHECEKRSIWKSQMDYFVDLVKGCDGLAFRANPDASIGVGVFREIETAQVNSKLIIELPSSIGRRELTVGQTREYLKETGQR